MTPLSVAIYCGSAGRAFRPRPRVFPTQAPAEIDLLRAENARLRSETKAQSDEIKRLVHEIERAKQQRRRNPLKLTVADIVDVVGEYYDITPKMIYGPTRAEPEVKARMVALYLAKELLSSKAMSLRQIGLRCGGRDHSSVHNSATKMAKRRGGDPHFDAEIVELIFELERLEGKDNGGLRNAARGAMVEGGNSVCPGDSR